MLVDIPGRRHLKSLSEMQVAWSPTHRLTLAHTFQYLTYTSLQAINAEAGKHPSATLTTQ